MSRLIDNIGLMLGRAPTKPAADDMTPQFRALLAFYRTPPERARRRDAVLKEKDEGQASNWWRYRRWASIVVVNLLFVASFHLDVQLIEGALTASRVFGFHFADLNSSLQVMLAYKEVLVNLLIGTATVLVMYLLLGGRTFCSWVCPYHLVSELAEIIHVRLADRGLVSDHRIHRGTRTVLYVTFAALAFVTGYTVFETINPVGILSRALTYGSIGALAWIGALLLVEIFWSRRFWCRAVCPVGLTYGIVGIVSAVRVRHDATKCLFEGKCRSVCLVPHVLDMTKLGYGKEVVTKIGPDCTRCARCLDVCPTGALSFEVTGVTAPAKPDLRGIDG